MLLKFPKDDQRFKWTKHIKDKMLFYQISEQTIKSVLKNYDRREDGIAPKTIAVMKRNDTPKRKQEIWVMYANAAESKTSKLRGRNPKRLVLISTWRYPGKSKPGKKIPIPKDTLEEIRKEWFYKLW